MPRNKDSTYGSIAIPWSHLAPDTPIRKGSSTSNAQLCPLARNQNTEFADRSPPLVLQGCQVSEAQRYCETPSGGGSLADIYLAWRGVFGQESRNALVAVVYARASDGTTAGEIRFQAEDRGVLTTITVPAATTTWTKFTTTAFQINGTLSGAGKVVGWDTVTCRMRRTSGAGRIQLDGVEMYMAQHGNPLSSGIEPSLFVAHDLLEVGADMPCPTMLTRRMAVNAEALVEGRGWLRPFIGECVPLQTAGAAIVGKATGRGNDLAVWRPVGPPLMWPRQHRKFALRYNIFAQEQGTGAKVRISNPYVNAVVEHDIPAYPVDPTVQSNWLTGELEVAGLPEGWHPEADYLDKILVEIISDGTNDAWVHGTVLQEAEG